MLKNCYTKTVNILEAIILGLIQGLTEFIPISSSGHLVAAQYFLSGANQHLFLQWINIGTVLALIIYFRTRILKTLCDIIEGRDFRLAINILIAMIPAGIVGFLFASAIESLSFFNSVVTVVVMLAVVGVILIILEKLPKASPVTSIHDLPKGRALIIGLAQVLALIPGTSRSGSTIIAGRLLGLSRAAAAEFSFLVSIPIMFGVLLKLLIGSDDRQYFVDNLMPLLWGNVAAFVSGLIAVGFLMKFLESRSLAVFGWYRVGLSFVLIGVLLVQ